MMTHTFQSIVALAIKHGATSYTNRADTQHPAYGFTESALTAFAQDLQAGQCLRQIAEPAIALSEQDATLLNQASEKLEEYASEQRRRGNNSAAEGAECSAHAVQRLGAALLAVQRNARPAQAVLDSNWKARMLDGRAIERDEMGFGEHPELPMLDEGMKPRAFFAALGVELKHTMAEDDLELAEQEAMNDAGNWSAWTPRPPAGEGWRLVAIFDTEDGTAAWWARNALTARATPRGA